MLDTKAELLENWLTWNTPTEDQADAIADALGLSLLELIEHYAEYEGGGADIESEQGYNNYIEQVFSELDADTRLKMRDDHPMQSEFESAIGDGLVKSGNMHPEQYRTYEIDPEIFDV